MFIQAIDSQPIINFSCNFFRETQTSFANNWETKPVKTMSFIYISSFAMLSKVRIEKQFRNRISSSL